MASISDWSLVGLVIDADGILTKVVSKDGNLTEGSNKDVYWNDGGEVVNACGFNNLVLKDIQGDEKSLDYAEKLLSGQLNVTGIQGIIFTQTGNCLITDVVNFVAKFVPNIAGKPTVDITDVTCYGVEDPDEEDPDLADIL